MFTFAYQLLDLVVQGRIGLFLAFFVISWAIHIIKLQQAGIDEPLKGIKLGEFKGKVSVIIPIVDEDPVVWRTVINGLKDALQGIKHEVFVIANGTNSVDNLNYVKKFGFKVFKIGPASKRQAVFEGAKLIKGIDGITIILDSDTEVTPDSIKFLLEVFKDNTVGGATPQHRISPTTNIWNRVSGWMEDMRFNETVKSQSYYGAVGCLPGRMLAIRSGFLQSNVEKLINEKFLGSDCISGDDRFLTSQLLEWGYKTVYVPKSIVYTQAPNTFKGFVMQRLRWSRTSFRETLRSLPWIFRYPWTAFITLSTVIMRWFFFIVIVNALLRIFHILPEPQHVLHLGTSTILVGTFLGFFLSGFLRQLRHLIAHPQDILYLPAFLLITTFILTPIEWFGNLSVRESGWMTRNTN